MPESNFASLLNSSSPQAAQVYTPGTWSSQYLPVKARSVPACRRMRYSSAVREAFHSASVFTTRSGREGCGRSPPALAGPHAIRVARTHAIDIFHMLDLHTRPLCRTGADGYGDQPGTTNRPGRSRTMATIADGHVVLFHYTLTDDEGTVLDTSRERGEPLPYLHGSGNIVPGLEAQMTGKSVGDTFKAAVAPGEGYGEHNGIEPQPVPRSEFPPEIPLQAGVQLMAQGPDGSAMPIWIADVDEQSVFIDTNHPLAGKTLNFDIEITGIREATEHEKQHGHAHGPDGSHSH